MWFWYCLVKIYYYNNWNAREKYVEEDKWS